MFTSCLRRVYIVFTSCLHRVAVSSGHPVELWGGVRVDVPWRLRGASSSWPRACSTLRGGDWRGDGEQADRTR